jgi:hypothetical protein
MRHPMNRVAMYAILVVIGANYLAQIPYRRNRLSAIGFSYEDNSPVAFQATTVPRP